MIASGASRYNVISGLARCSARLLDLAFGALAHRPAALLKNEWRSGESGEVEKWRNRIS
jgi:hypothetical protein